MTSGSVQSFSVNFLKALINDSKDKNIFYSPLSIMAAFSMLLRGTQKESSNQIIRALQYDEKSLVNIHKDIGEMLEKCITVENEYDKTELSIANGLFTQLNFPIKADYKSDLGKFYKSELKEINFGSPNAVKEVNQWIESKTHDKIKDMFQENSFNEMTKLVLANAIYFKSGFVDAFPSDNTTEKPFYKDHNTKHMVQMMQTRGDFTFIENSKLGLKALAIPFQNYNFKFLLVLPTKRFGLDDVLVKLKEKDLTNLISSLQLRMVSKLEVPKFKLETQMDLKTLLTLLGIKDVFDKDKANLKGISEEHLWVDNAIHKTFLDVNENGVEAAAATAMSVRATSMPMYADDTPVEFVVDEPFLLSVYNIAADSIVFLGRVNNP